MNSPASNTHSDPEPQRPGQTPMRTLCPKPAKDPATNTPPPPRFYPPPNFTQKNPDKKPLVVCHLPPRNHPMPFLTKPPPPHLLTTLKKKTTKASHSQCLQQPLGSISLPVLLSLCPSLSSSNNPEYTPSN